jgi:UDP-galactopyranose mutase
VIPDLLCFSHLRWDYVTQRPNHLMTRAARDRRVYFVEEPQDTEHPVPRMTKTVRGGVHVITPWLPTGLADDARQRALAVLMDTLVRTEGLQATVLWYYTPMALPWTTHLRRSLAIYDCMDYLAGFLDAPPGLVDLETQLLARADLVFCGGTSLHRRLVPRHGNSHCFPSSVDIGHFGQARAGLAEPSDQRAIAGPRIGYAGVIDERLDLDLIRGVAHARPDWQVVLIGPIAKISPELVPSAPNIHLLGAKPYADLPAYLAGWDVGWMPFARNEATRYISPTKTPEYLAAGLPVVSTSITDVVHPYGDEGLVSIADTVTVNLDAIDRVLSGVRPSLASVDRFLEGRSWDKTWTMMSKLIDATRARGLETMWPVERHASDRVAGGVPVMAGVAAGSAAETTS